MKHVIKKLKKVDMERFICKLSSSDSFKKEGYSEVGLWDSNMFRYTLWKKIKDNC